jgi:murein DD-endopeptidase MepM/ murein hydrolase activator NlpD
VSRPRRAREGSLAAAALLLLLAAETGEAGPKAAAPSAVAPPAAGQRVHLVQRGDTLSALAARYKVTVAALVAANRLSGEQAVLRVGQRLVVPATTASPPAKMAPPARTTPEAKATPPAKASPPAKRAPGAKAAAGAPPKATAPKPMPTRGPRNLELVVPDFVDAAPPFIWPVEGDVTSTFGRRRSGWHRGIDITAPPGSMVVAAAPGTVVVSAVEPRYGRVVKIEHDDGFMTVYAHNETNLVEVGAQVAAGDPIATLGRTGWATAPHLHFEIRRGEAVYNPLYLLPLPPRVAHVDLSDEPEEEHE